MKIRSIIMFAFEAWATKQAKKSSKKYTDDLQIIKNIHYGFHKDNIGDVYLPRSTKDARIILLIHGGGWRSMTRHRMNSVAIFLASIGYAVFNIDYRLLPQAPYPACEKDSIAAAKFLLNSGNSALAGLRRDKILIAGASSGAHLALMAGLKLPRNNVAGIIDISGPTDLTAPKIKPLLDKVGFCDGHEDHETLLNMASPVKLAKNDPPPLLILHSRNDKLVDCRQADHLYNSWRAKGGEVSLLIYKGATRNHDIWGDRQKAPHLKERLEKQISLFLESIYPASL